METTRRHGQVLEQAILEAVGAELDDRGYDGLTYEAVAARAATSKSVIYRRWPLKHELVVAALLADTLPRAPIPDTGSFVDDLAELLRTLRQMVDHTGRRTALNLLARLDAEATEALQELLFARGTEYLTPILAHARERGELGPAPIPAVILALPLDLARHQALIRGRLTDEAVVAISRDISAPLFALHSRNENSERAPT